MAEDNGFEPVVDWSEILKRHPEAAPIHARMQKALALPDGNDDFEQKVWRAELAFDRCDFETCAKILDEIGVDPAN